MQGILNQPGRRWGAIGALVGVVALGGCSTYQPLDGGARVPWARTTVAQQGVEAESSSVRLAGKRVGNGEPTPVPPEAQAVDLSGRVHKVRRGEALAHIARQHGVNVYRLAAVNHVTPPYTIYVGQILRVPGDGPPPAVEPAAGPEGRRYVVQRGDALAPLARRFGVPMRQIASVNGIEPPYRIYPGQELRLPAGSREPVVARREPGPAAAKPAPRALSADGFVWPVKGKVVERFGRTASGERHDGINIAARKGAPVRAAEDGVVVYAGDGIRGYGRIVMLRHADDYITMYGHNAALLVNAGDAVERGQVIARVGSSGDVDSAQLHFEIRKGRTPVDPERLLVSEPTEVASSE